MHQSLETKKLLIIPRSKSTPLSDADQLVSGRNFVNSNKVNIVWETMSPISNGDIQENAYEQTFIGRLILII